MTELPDQVVYRWIQARDGLYLETKQLQLVFHQLGLKTAAAVIADAERQLADPPKPASLA